MTAPPAGLNLAELFGALGVGRTRLHQCFVDAFGISAGQYIRKNRLSQARPLSEETDVVWFEGGISVLVAAAFLALAKQL